MIGKRDKRRLTRERRRLDNGGSVSKAGLFDCAGTERAVATAIVPQILPQAGDVERDTNLLYQANVQCIREVIRKSGVEPREIGGVSAQPGVLRPEA